MFNDQKPLLISFSGMDGSGKTTQIEMMCDALAKTNLPLIRLAFWDNVVAFPKWRAKFSHKFLKSEGGAGAPGKPVHRNDKNNRAWYLIAARYGLFLFDALRLRKAVKVVSHGSAQVIVFDRYIYDQLATLPLDSFFGRFYAKVLMHLVPRPDIPFLLDADPRIARERKPEYPLGFLYIYQQAYLRLARLAGLAVITPGTLEEVHISIMRNVQAGLSQQQSSQPSVRSIPAIE